jgi:threonine synthase
VNILNETLAQHEGVFAEPSGAAGLAGLKRLLEGGTVGSSDVVVVEITGGGLKDPETALKLFEKPRVVGPELNRLEKRKTCIIGAETLATR